MNCAVVGILGEPRAPATSHNRRTSADIWGFPKIRGTCLGVPMIRITVFWGSILGFPYFGKLPYGEG